MNALEAINPLLKSGFSPELEERVMAAGDPELAYRYAFAIEEANLDRLEPIVLTSSDPRLVFDFALIKAERGGDVNQLETHIIESGDAGLMILFAADIEGADIDRLETVIRSHPDKKYSLLFEAEMKIRGHGC